MLKKLAVTVAMAGLLQSVPALAQYSTNPANAQPAQQSSGAPQQNHAWTTGQPAGQPQGGQQQGGPRHDDEFWKKWQAMSKEEKLKFAEDRHHEQVEKMEERWKSTPAEQKIHWIEQQVMHSEERREEHRLEHEEWQADHTGAHPMGNGQQGGINNGQGRPANVNSGAASGGTAPAASSSGQ